MVVFECVTVANEGCRCLEGCYGEVLKDCVFQQGTASNSNKSTPACSPVLRKRSRSPTPQSQEGENMVEKGSDHSSDKSPSTPEQVVQRTYSLQSARSGGKNSKKSQSWYNRLIIRFASTQVCRHASVATMPAGSRKLATRRKTLTNRALMREMTTLNSEFV
ncbi:GRAM domain-containing protein 1B [Collichthys lucidus]|uniref:GRAM domain-containing protein 1B n=1 Tax=Collichthys lucidus TaxID=240159 RepID=A0A4U5V0U8_COLLU|nr:GRAM domain-containing protein 1B [Collichthys lucidus]